MLLYGRCLKVAGSVRQAECKRNSHSCPGIDAACFLALVCIAVCVWVLQEEGSMMGPRLLPCSEGAVNSDCPRIVRQPYCWCYFDFKSRFKNLRAFQATGVRWCFWETAMNNGLFSRVSMPVGQSPAHCGPHGLFSATQLKRV